MCCNPYWIEYFIEKRIYGRNYDGVTITVDENRISKTGITLIIKNDTDKELTFGEDYILEKKILGQ